MAKSYLGFYYCVFREFPIYSVPGLYLCTSSEIRALFLLGSIKMDNAFSQVIIPTQERMSSGTTYYVWG